MKRTAVILVTMLWLVTISACKFSIGTVAGSGVRKAEQRDLPPFKAIDIQGALKIEATAQKAQAFEIEGDDNILPLIKSEVRDGILYLKAEKGYRSPKGIFIRITVPSLDSIKTTGASEFSVRDLKNEKFEVRSTGASTVHASGRSTNVEIHSTGAGLVDTHGLNAVNANVSSSGAANIDVYASEQLDVSASGAGAVIYSGDPKTVKQHLTGAASLSKREPSVN
jgi:hypothetical protein